MTEKIDPDVLAMTVPELRREIMRIRRQARKELAHTGNHRCWVNVLRMLPEGETLQPLSLPRGEFLGNCAQYYDRNQKPSP